MCVCLKELIRIFQLFDAIPFDLLAHTLTYFLFFVCSIVLIQTKWEMGNCNFEHQTHGMGSVEATQQCRIDREKYTHKHQSARKFI